MGRGKIIAPAHPATVRRARIAALRAKGNGRSAAETRELLEQALAELDDLRARLDAAR